MENASRALIIAGEVLIALLVLSVGMSFVMSVRTVTDSYMSTMTEQEVARFNSYFIKLDGRTDILVQEVISAINYAQEFNTQKAEGNVITVTAAGLSGTVSNNSSLNHRDLNNTVLVPFIQANMYRTDGTTVYFTCEVRYNEVTDNGILTRILFTLSP